jgi:hypothetical protein
MGGVVGGVARVASGAVGVTVVCYMAGGQIFGCEGTFIGHHVVQEKMERAG